MRVVYGDSTLTLALSRERERENHGTREHFFGLESAIVLHADPNMTTGPRALDTSIFEG